MAELPSGTVTFLLSDVEGSTALWEEAPEAMRAALARHDALFETSVAEHGGIHIRPRGEDDSRFAVFASAPDAVAAAVAIQGAFAAEPWPTPRPITVRIGLHTGEAELRDGDYYGAAVNRCSRLRGIGHGAQTLLSEATTGLVRDDLPDGASLVDLGDHRLRDLSRPERVHHVVAPGLPADFPPLVSLGARPHNLPLQITSLLGREHDVQAVRGLLLRDDVRLVTLTGPGGTGKTRLGLQVAADLLDHFPDGVFFVDLAPISDSELVASAVALVLGLRATGGRSLRDIVTSYLEERRLLLLLDNFEQILPAAALVAAMLAACPSLAVLVTSREPLRLRGEREYAVPPLALPSAHDLPAADTLSDYAAVALFVERAAAIRPDFAVTSENASAIADICVRLDGLPLAIELAAARTRLLAPREIVGRLGRRLPLLTGGARDLPTRQQTLRATIDWSHDLLDEAERRLFRALAVFVGGWSLAATEAVCTLADLDRDVLSSLESLAAKSLVRHGDGPDGEPRFGMLETIREYAREELEASGELDAIRQRCAAFFLALAEDAHEKLLGRDQLASLERLDAELDQLRAIFGWSRDEGIGGDIGLRLAAALYLYWEFRGLGTEGHAWVMTMLSLPGASARTVARARALYSASWLDSMRGDFAGQRSLAQESADIFQEAGQLLEAGRSLTQQAIAESRLGAQVAARALLERSAEIARELGDQWGLTFAVGQLGHVAYQEGDLAAARGYREEAASVARAVGDRHTLGLALAGLALVARTQGYHDESAKLFQETLLVSSELKDQWIMPRATGGLAGAAVLAGDYERAARLFGATVAMRDTSGIVEATRTFRDLYERDEAEARAALGDEAFAAAWAAGRAMTPEQAVAYALDERPSA